MVGTKLEQFERAFRDVAFEAIARLEFGLKCFDRVDPILDLRHHVLYWRLHYTAEETTLPAIFCLVSTTYCTTVLLLSYPPLSKGA